MSHTRKPPSKLKRCQAKMSTHGDGKSGTAFGERCPNNAVHEDPAGIALCWTHSHARYNVKRSRPLDMVLA